MARENSNELRIAMPTTLMDVGHHFNDIPWVAQRGLTRQDRVINMAGEEETPRKILEDIVLKSYSRQPNIRI